MKKERPGAAIPRSTGDATARLGQDAASTRTTLQPMSAQAPVVPLAGMAGAFAVVLGLVGLIGWAADIAPLKSVLRGAVEMKPNTALGLIGAGIALWTAGAASPRWRALASAAALAVAALGLATLGEYVLGWRLGIDELLFRDGAKAYNAIPGRMSPYSTVAFAAMGVALAALARERARPMVAAGATIALAIGLLSVLGYVWNASELVTDAMLPPVAVHTALAFTLLAVGTLATLHARRARAAPVIMSRASVEFKVITGFVGAFLLLVIGGGITHPTGAEFARSAGGGARGPGVRTQPRRPDLAASA